MNEEGSSDNMDIGDEALDYCNVKGGLISYLVIGVCLLEMLWEIHVYL